MPRRLAAPRALDNPCAAETLRPSDPSHRGWWKTPQVVQTELRFSCPCATLDNQCVAQVARSSGSAGPVEKRAAGRSRPLRVCRHSTSSGTALHKTWLTHSTYCLLYTSDAADE